MALAPQAAHALYVDDSHATAFDRVGAIEATGMSVAVKPPTFITAEHGTARAVTLSDLLPPTDKS